VTDSLYKYIILTIGGGTKNKSEMSFLPNKSVRVTDNTFSPSSSSRDGIRSSSREGFSESTELSSLFRQLSLYEPAKTAGSEYFMLPIVNKDYLRSHKIEEWLAIWDKQVQDTVKDGVKLTDVQLRKILCNHIRMPFSEDIVKCAIEKDLASTIDLVKAKCKTYTPVPIVLAIVKKKTSETFEEYLLRLQHESLLVGITYSDQALSNILYTDAPASIRTVVDAVWSKESPTELAAAIDREIDRRRGLQIALEIQPYMMQMDQIYSNQHEEPAQSATMAAMQRTRKPAQTSLFVLWQSRPQVTRM